ncbi:MAG TPA: hypothetical protein VGF39_11360 [Stellaceae bacterium]
MINVANTVVTASLVFLLQSATGSAADSGERHVVLTNHTRHSIVEIYVSDDGADYWQEDRLRSEPLLPGKSVIIDVDDPNGNCRVDVKTVLDNGSELVTLGIHACRHADLIR